MALGSTQPLTEMSTRCISWGVRVAQCLEMTALAPLCADCLEILESANLRACRCLYRDYFNFCLLSID